ncbi:hypothetical protein [Chryseobacterium pennipullorum]|uniref:Uncharacterized protein n=1 Tax=Chryseobacterium pennipullorum TaxID=2258963 RepID=A0A3D9AZC9_9FLAO|nr:hypothetical protein [Chryseobacterium pennipullorum]REC46609.1 hypothetical protein DRF67_13765 [Chryseobacterium pennipullorum]
MKEFAKYDYFIQLFVSIIAVITTVAGFQTWGFMAFYVIVGIFQLISFLIRLFIKTKKSVMYVVYGITILPVWSSILCIFLCKQNNGITNFLGYILIGALIYSPIMAILYIHETYHQYKNLK